MGEETAVYGPIRYTRRMVRRNEVCPFCTSGRKFKFCHGAPSDPADETTGGPTPRLLRMAGAKHEIPVCFVGTRKKPKGERPAVRERLS